MSRLQREEEERSQEELDALESTCFFCDGDGTINKRDLGAATGWTDVECFFCGGTGIKNQGLLDALDRDSKEQKKSDRRFSESIEHCDNCEAFGLVKDEEGKMVNCPACGGTGRLKSALNADRTEP